MYPSLLCEARSFFLYTATAQHDSELGLGQWDGQPNSGRGPTSSSSIAQTGWAEGLLHPDAPDK